MAQQMSIREMVRMIEDVLGGSLEFTVWKPKGTDDYRLEVKSLDEGGSEVGQTEVGQTDIELTQRETSIIRLRMTTNIQYPLEELPFGVVQFIAFKSKDFREYINRELIP